MVLSISILLMYIKAGWRRGGEGGLVTRAADAKAHFYGFYGRAAVEGEPCENFMLFQFPIWTILLLTTQNAEMF